jgi:hypothetical protein
MLKILTLATTLTLTASFSLAEEAVPVVPTMNETHTTADLATKQLTYDTALAALASIDTHDETKQKATYVKALVYIQAIQIDSLEARLSALIKAVCTGHDYDEHKHAAAYTGVCAERSNKFVPKMFYRMSGTLLPVFTIEEYPY